MATKKSLTKPRFRTSYQKTDKRNCKTADQVILEWFQSHGNVTRAFSNGSLGLVQFRYTKEIWLAVNKQSSPLRTLGSVRSRIHRWLRDLQQARMMAKEGSSKRGKCALTMHHWYIIPTHEAMNDSNQKDLSLLLRSYGSYQSPTTSTREERGHDFIIRQWPAWSRNRARSPGTMFIIIIIKGQRYTGTFLSYITTSTFTVIFATSTSTDHYPIQTNASHHDSKRWQQRRWWR